MFKLFNPPLPKNDDKLGSYMKDISEKMDVMEKHANLVIKENEELKEVLPKLYKHMSSMVERLKKYENN